jgi:hypothetical protein
MKEGQYFLVGEGEVHLYDWGYAPNASGSRNICLSLMTFRFGYSLR